jgi:hypothetical protein
MAMISDTSARICAQPVVDSFNPNKPTVTYIQKAPGVAARSPAAASAGSQCCHTSTATPMIKPAITFSKNNGPTTGDLAEVLQIPRVQVHTCREQHAGRRQPADDI